MWVGFPIIEVEGLQWAVTVVTWQCLKGTYCLRLRRGYTDKFMDIAASDFDALFSPETNPQQPFFTDGE